ncbi:MAG TPA: isoprenylcysteine carboxylmethyltransferase family protein [Rhodopila sp.]
MQMLNPGLRLVLAVLGTVGYLGLAVLGWGGFAAFFSHPALTAVAVIQCALAIAALFAGGNLSPGVKEDRGNRWVLAAIILPSLLQAWLPAWTDRHDLWCLDGEIARWTGVVLFAVGGVLRLWPVFVLGNRFSGLVAIQEGHTLVTDGIYRRIRNPSYLGLLLGALGWSLAFRSWAGIILTAVMVPPLMVRMSSEERLLQAEFGAEYAAYRARTARLLPRIY